MQLFVPFKDGPSPHVDCPSGKLPWWYSRNRGSQDWIQKWVSVKKPHASWKPVSLKTGLRISLQKISNPCLLRGLACLGRSDRGWGLREKWVTGLQDLFLLSFPVAVCGAVCWDFRGTVESLTVPPHHRLGGSRARGSSPPRPGPSPSFVVPVWLTTPPLCQQTAQRLG